jgi:PAS domain S-box-containing protein
MSLALAGRMARRITGPVQELERHAADVVAGRAVHLHSPTPEIRRVWAALEDAARERRRTETAEAAQFGAYTYDVCADRIFWSPELKRLFGAENIGENVDRNTADSFVHPQDRQRKATVVREILSGVHERHQLEFRIVRCGNGAERWVMDRGRAISEGGKVVRVVGVIIDISDLKAAEQRQKL